jgi:chromosome segregation protein
LQTREGTARAARAATEGEARALGAEAQALAALIARESRAGAQVLDQLTVAPGYERALGAALGDDLRSPIAETAGQSGWVAPAGAAPPAAAPLPEGAEPLAPHVAAPPALARRLAHVGVADPARAADLQPRLAPGQRLVSRAGDLWRWDGFRLLAGDAPSAAALRLEQVNRLASLRRDLEEANARAQGARQAHERLGAELAAASEADRAAREARRAADQALAAAGRTRSEADAARAVAAGRLEAARLAEGRLAAEHAEAAARLTEAEAQLAALPAPAGTEAAIAALRAEVEAGRSAMLAARSRHDEAQREGERRARRRAEIARDSVQWTERRAAAERRSAELSAESARIGAERTAAATEPARLAAEAERLQGARTSAAARAVRAADALQAAEVRLREAQAAERRAEAEATELREARAGAEARAESAAQAETDTRARIAEVTEGEGPESLLARIGAEAEAVPESAVLEDDIARLRRARDALGAVNLRAEEDARAIEAEHANLGREKADLDAAIRTLRAGIGGLNREGRERLLTAFEQVNGNFTTLFTHLFGGGSARLVLVESDDPLEAGLEIMCQPPGKKLSTLSLLSGGEQTLTALALIFAVFLANPSPICVLDEVDAPLDDANVTRFCDLLDEMTRRTETRFLVITHHAVTMARMDRLFGVTMAEQGVSQLVSVDLRAAEAMVA